MRIGILTGGGDCPGLNAVIRAVVRKGEGIFGHNVVGFRYGWRGVMEAQFDDLTVANTRGILPRGGTILRTSRTNPYKTDGGVERVLDTLRREHIEALIAIGGEDTLGVASHLVDEGVNIVGVPKTIDNDLSATDFTFGFDTAVQIATEAIDRLHSTAESHDRVMVVEVMGRHAGWIATYAGLAGGADVILIPEEPFDVEQVCDHLRHRHQRGPRFSIVVVAEGALPKEGTMVLASGEVAQFGHVRLGGSPTAYDRVLASRFGVEAIDAANEHDFGKMVALRGPDIVRVPIADAVAELKTVDRRIYDVASVFFG